MRKEVKICDHIKYCVQLPSQSKVRSDDQNTDQDEWTNMFLPLFRSLFSFRSEVGRPETANRISSIFNIYLYQINQISLCSSETSSGPNFFKPIVSVYCSGNEVYFRLSDVNGNRLKLIGNINWPGSDTGIRYNQ